MNKETKAIGIIRLTRIEHSIMLVIAVLAAELIASPFGYHIYDHMMILLLSIITPIFISMSSFAINDIFDVKTDIENKMTKRPIVSGAITKREAIATALICMIIGVSASAFINLYALLIAIIFASLAFLYSYKLKESPLIGNIYIALSMAIPFIFGNYVVSKSINLDIIMIGFIIFLSGLAREIHGMIRDYKGDIKIRKSKNLVKYIGIQKSAAIALVLYAEAIALSIFLFFFYPPFLFNLFYIVPIAITDIMLVYVAVSFLYKANRSRGFFDLSRNVSLCAMALALFAFLISSILHVII